LLKSHSLILALSLALPAAAQTTSSKNVPVNVTVFDRTRVDSWQWFAAPPSTNSYGYVESLLRVGVAQKLHRWDWQLELAQPSVLDAPDNSVSPLAAQGQLGLGATYFAANNNSYPAAAFLKQGFIRFNGEGKHLRVGRFEFFDGQETQPANSTINWLQTNRIAQRLIANFGFSNAQRSYDGLDAHWNTAGWNITALAARADQGVFNMNGNPELNVDVQYLAATRQQFHNRLLWRTFAAAYHDGRTGLTKVDNRALSVRSTDHVNLRIGTYGADLLASVPAGPGQFDFLFWGALQNGSWGKLSHRADAAAVEAGYQFSQVATSPWLRGGWFRSSGDDNPADSTHNTFFQLMPTPRIYARTPFYNLMNSTDEFFQVVDKPVKPLAVRADLHWLQLTSAHDLWYLGGGAFDNKVFGYTGRPSNNAASLASLADISADWQATKSVALNFYYACARGKTVPAAIYPIDRTLQYGYVELVYRWNLK